MKNVKLIKSLSYRGNGVYVKKDESIDVSDEKAKELEATGFFTVVGDAKGKADDSDDDAAGVAGDSADGDDGTNNGAGDDSDDEKKVSEKPVSKMNGTELRAYAEAKGYDVSECTKVEEIRSLIEALDAQ